MAMLIDQEAHTTSLGQIIGRGFVAAHGVLIGAFLLFLLHAPAQVLNAVAQSLQASMRGAPGQLDPMQISLTLMLSGGSLAFAVAVCFLFPLVQGGILGQVRDRLESPHQAAGRFGSYGRAHYLRLLGSLGLVVLLTFAVMVPVMCLGGGLAVYQVYQLTPEVPDNLADKGAPPFVPDSQQFTRMFLTQPAIVAVMAIMALILAAVGMVYWIANCIIVSESGFVLASWRLALRFCRQNLSAVVPIGLLTVAASLVVAPLSLAGQLGFVTDLWAVAGMALLYAAALGYVGVVCAGLTMSLYLARRPPAWQPEFSRVAP